VGEEAREERFLPLSAHGEGHPSAIGISRRAAIRYAARLLEISIMRRASSLFAAAALLLTTAVASADGGVDSGVGTTPSPGNPVVAQDGGGDGGTESPDDTGGCNVVPESEGGSPVALAFGVAAGIFVLSRRRRGAARR
jgi:MYXO-CTERM domain-containing protein